MPGMSVMRDQDYWRARAEQLENALESRVVIEQAKGILAERLGLPMDTAFELLRYAARGARLKLSDLASQLVNAEETPQPIVEAIARHRPRLAAASHAKRPVQNEAFFHAITEEQGGGGLEGGSVLVCECAELGCHETLILTRDEAGRLRAGRSLFAVHPGHELSDQEEVVARSPRCLIVMKKTPGSGDASLEGIEGPGRDGG